MSIDLITPVGRIVQGNLYKPNEEDQNGNPLTIKTGVNAGQRRVDFYFALAIKKGTEQHWANTEWGQQIYGVGAKSWPNGQYQRQDFAWKITDGDSTIPNKSGKKPCDMPGFAGHWVLKLSSGFPPQIVSSDGRQQLHEEGLVKPGYYVQVRVSVRSNDNPSNPGIYLNHSFVAFSAHGEEIVFGPDPASLGFGQAPLPAGASPVPLANPAFNPGQPAVPPVAAAPAVQVSPPAPASAPPPNPAILQVPGSPPPPPPAPAKKLTPAAQGATYEQLIANGWTDELLIQHGLMVA